MISMIFWKGILNLFYKLSCAHRIFIYFRFVREYNRLAHYFKELGTYSIFHINDTHTHNNVHNQLTITILAPNIKFIKTQKKSYLD